MGRKTAHPYCRKAGSTHPEGSHRETKTPADIEIMPSKGNKDRKMAIWSAGGALAFISRSGNVMGRTRMRTTLMRVCSAFRDAFCMPLDIRRSISSILGAIAGVMLVRSGMPNKRRSQGLNSVPTPSHDDHDGDKSGRVNTDMRALWGAHRKSNYYTLI